MCSALWFAVNMIVKPEVLRAPPRLAMPHGSAGAACHVGAVGLLTESPRVDPRRVDPGVLAWSLGQGADPLSIRFHGVDSRVGPHPTPQRPRPGTPGA